MHKTLCSTRVSNELGAGNAQAAKMTVKAMMVLVVAEMVIVAMILSFCHRVLGYVFSSKKEIVYSIIMDGLQAVLSGNFLTFLSCNGL